jgi:phosphoribosylamine---glycine ligase
LRLESDLLELLMATARGELKNASVRWHNEPALTVVLAANGYPGDVEKGSHINGLNQVFENGVEVFHAGTALDGEFIVSNGGRVLNVTALGATVKDAQRKAYAAVDQINWQGGFCRRDIGWRAT